MFAYRVLHPPWKMPSGVCKLQKAEKHWVIYCKEEQICALGITIKSVSINAINRNILDSEAQALLLTML